MSDKVAPGLQRFGVQLFSCDPSIGMRPEGSGVFVQYQQELFIFTVVHVLRAFRKQKLWIPLNERFVEVERPFSVTSTEDLEDENWEGSSDPNADLDAAILHVPLPLASNYEGVRMEDTDRLIYPSDPDSTAYVLIGYPGSHTEVDDEKREVETCREPFVLLEVDPIVYSQQNVKPWKRLLLARRRRTRLNFASGGAVWQITLRGTIRTPFARLVATFVDAGDYYASGARIGIHLELAQRFIAARSQLPTLVPPPV